MKVNVKKQPRSLLEINVELTSLELEPYLKKAATKISQQSEFQGFRKGTAPFEVVKAKVGDMALYQEAGALAINETLGKAIEEQKLMTIGDPEIRVDKLAPGNPFIYTATIALLPDVELPDMTKISVTRKSAEVPEKDIQKVIDDLREVRAAEVVADKNVEKGDMVHLDFDVFQNKVPIDGGQGRKYPLVIGKNQMIPGFEDQLVGLKKGDNKEFTLKFPADYPNKVLAGKPADFKVKILDVFTRTLPPLNDDLAKQFGMKDVAEFKKGVRTSLENDTKSRVEREAELEMIDQMVAGAKVTDVPDVLINSETHKMLDEMKENIESRGMKFEDYLLNLKKKPAELMLEFTPEALKRVKVALIIRKIGEQQKLTASSAEIDKEVEAYRERYKGNREAEAQIASPGFRRYVENLILNRKAVEYVKTQVIK